MCLAVDIRVTWYCCYPINLNCRAAGEIHHQHRHILGSYQFTAVEPVSLAIDAEYI